jgi:hypothetical protein
VGLLGFEGFVEDSVRDSVRGAPMIAVGTSLYLIFCFAFRLFRAWQIALVVYDCAHPGEASDDRLLRPLSSLDRAYAGLNLE